MTAVDALNYYLCANVLLIVAAVLVGFFKRQFPPGSGSSHKQRLIGANAISLSVGLLPMASLFVGNEPSMYAAQVWAASSMEGMSAVVPSTAVVEATGVGGLTVPLISAMQFWMAVLISGAVISLSRLMKDAQVVRQIIMGAQRFRIRGGLRILSSDDVTVPFSLWAPFRFYIVVPSALILNPGQLRVALRHEAQHHRQADTKLLYVYLSLKTAFFWNPAAHLMERWLREFQEFACDEAVIAHGDIGREEYCHCLLHMAEASSAKSQTMLCASMAGNTNPGLLRERVIAVLQPPVRDGLSWYRGALAAIAAGVMAVMAIAFSSIVKDRRVSLEVADHMVEAAQIGSSVPLSVNQDVLQQLNILLATPDGQVFLNGSLQRMREYGSLISSEIESSKLPWELLAVPLIESGYQNLPPGDNPKHGAGIWMFIAHTARNFGLRIDSERDERLDVAAQTKAAVRLFSSLHAQFGDWGLAFLGYNVGSAQVERAIIEAGSRDPWEVIAAVKTEDAQYLSRLMAAILIINETTAGSRSVFEADGVVSLVRRVPLR